MKRILIMGLLFPLLSIAQSSQHEGIQWTTGLSWEQVKQKAKQENKYIFIDVYATWCGPCKKMDKDVYTNDSVGSVFNVKFINIKLQMDQTQKDEDQVKRWYKDAVAIGDKYNIREYPTFIFLSPNADIVHKAAGSLGVADFVILGKLAITKKYLYAEYEHLLEDYKSGYKNYDRMPYMIKTAYEVGDNDFGKQLLEEHTDHLAKQRPKGRYTKETIELWAGFPHLRSDGLRFKFFYKDGKIIDKVMNEKGYADAVVDRTIKAEVIDSFFTNQKGGDGMLQTGMKMMRTDGKIQPNQVEADWHLLDLMIREKFSRSCAKRNVLNARIEWYKEHKNFPQYSKYALIRYKNNPPNLEKNLANVGIFNQWVWATFLYVNDKNILNEAADFTQKILQRSSAIDTSKYACADWLYDSYAAILYKTGRTQDAIHWEEKAMNFAIFSGGDGFVSPEEYKGIIEQMKRGEKTHLEHGAIWE